MLSLFLAGQAAADVLVLKDGRRVEGTITLDLPDKLKIRTALGEVEFARADVSSIERGKTRQEELAERESHAKTGEELCQVGLWAEKQGLKQAAKRLMQRAIEVDKNHTAARQWLGHVQYKGVWMTPEARDAQQVADEAADMLAKGLVRYQDRWVTPEERAKLEQGLILVDGKWLTFAEAQHKLGLEEFEGRWLARAEALARADVRAAEKITKLELNVFLAPDAILAGPQSEHELALIAEGMKRGRDWFTGAFSAPAGLELLGNRLAEFYLFDVPTSDRYVQSVDHFASLTRTVNAEWVESVKKMHGFLWWDPYPLSCARQWHRPPEDLVGHCYHHWGHLLLNRLGYDGRLLPPWFDEGVAALFEHRVHQRNAVFCRGSRKDTPRSGPTTGPPSTKPNETKSKAKAVPTRTTPPFDASAMRDGEWKKELKAGQLELPPFSDLCALQFNELEGADIALSMGIVEWLEAKGALRRFLDELRKESPLAPVRVIPDTWERQAVYEKAFRAAVKLSVKEAEAAWRQWIAKS